MEQEFLRLISSKGLLAFGALAEFLAVLVAGMAICTRVRARWYVHVPMRILAVIVAVVLFLLVRAYVHDKQVAKAAADPYLYDQLMQARELDSRYKELARNTRERMREYRKR